MVEPLLILGASARAAAMSARRAGLRVWAADLFADLDLRRCGPAVAVERYPAGLEQAVRHAPDGPWIYTGGLENHPGLVDRIAKRRPLLGNPGPVLRDVRNPLRVAGTLASAGLAVPEVRLAPAETPADGSWLRKPLGGCGGSGIAVWNTALARRRDCPPRGDCYFQRRIAGAPCAALYVAAAGRAALLGITRQLVAEPWTHAGPFQYAGSLGPVLDGPLREQAERIGGVLAARFGLTGLFGVDAILAGGTLWPVEVNPRYTASVEVLERALGMAALAWHVEACLEGRLPQTAPRTQGRFCGKAVLFAPADLVVPPGIAEFALAQNPDPQRPNLADLPAPGTEIRAGRPVVTVLAEVQDEASLDSALRRLAARAYALFSPSRDPR